MNRISLCSLGLILGLGVATPATADPIIGELFYTRYQGAGDNVKKVSLSYDGASTFSLGIPTGVGTTPGADGITGNPKNADLLIVGGQGFDISTISKSTGTVSTIGSPVSVFHLAVPTSNTVLASAIPGGLARHPILSSGALGAGTAISLSGDDTVLTTVISTPSGFFYTQSGSGGFGTYGMITFNTGVDTATTATTSRLRGPGGSVDTANVPAAHGGTYDPFTNTVILMGDGHITQLDLSGNILSERLVSGVTFDQGTVDGMGHLFAATNQGYMLFVDYAATGLVGDSNNFSALPFLDTFLDDVAPLVGPGRTTSIPEPGVLYLLALAFLGVALVTRRRVV